MLQYRVWQKTYWVHSFAKDFCWGVIVFIVAQTLWPNNSSLLGDLETVGFLNSLIISILMYSALDYWHSFLWCCPINTNMNYCSNTSEKILKGGLGLVWMKMYLEEKGIDFLPLFLDLLFLNLSVSLLILVLQGFHISYRSHFRISEIIKVETNFPCFTYFLKISCAQTAPMEPTQLSFAHFSFISFQLLNKSLP